MSIQVLSLSLSLFPSLTLTLVVSYRWPNVRCASLSKSQICPRAAVCWLRRLDWAPQPLLDFVLLAWPSRLNVRARASEEVWVMRRCERGGVGDAKVWARGFGWSEAKVWTRGVCYIEPRLVPWLLSLTSWLNRISCDCGSCSGRAFAWQHAVRLNNLSTITSRFRLARITYKCVHYVHSSAHTSIEIYFYTVDVKSMSYEKSS